jgi:predicted Zn-dependent protease
MTGSKALIKRIACSLTVMVFFALFLLGSAGSLANSFSFIRDAEIENTIRIYSTPLFQAAGLEPSDIKIYLVKDNSLNAFVAGGQKIFINTGLLMKSRHAGQVIGVIAHETGHIASGHLSRARQALKKSTAQTILAYILGGAAAIGGRPDVGQVIVLGGKQTGLRSLLHYSRTQESAADQAALRFLDTTNQSAQGLLEFFDTLSGQELLSASRQDPYLRSHPLTRERMDAIRAHLVKSPNTDKPFPSRFQEMHKRMRAKLYAFLEPLAITLRRYKETDNSLVSRYARAIAYYRHPDLEKALRLIDGLIKDRPDDPYFHELKGQMLFENGRAAAALGSYERAVQLLPHSALLRSGLAQAQLELNDPALLDQAILNFRAALLREKDVPFFWHQLAIAYGRQGRMGHSSLALAEEAMLQGNPKVARYQAGRAATILPRGSVGWLQSQDILQAAKKK